MSPIPTELAEESTNKVPLSQFKSPVPPVRAVSVPRLVILGCAAVASVPVISPDIVMLVSSFALVIAPSAITFVVILVLAILSL